MTRRIVLKPVDNGLFELRTERGFVLGPRLFSIAPKKGSDWPTIPETPLPELEARKIATAWNVYFVWVDSQKKKTVESYAD
ncbi:MAG: hypothetical protein E6Q97_20760 [Desulfurellales bacterium]|nr:MAG: hypothetical protein E6Q97_20760 [Desulfurellales bacterium]